MIEYISTINSRKHEVNIIDEFQVMIDGKIINVELTKLNSNAYLFKYGNKVFEICANKIDKDRFGFLIAGSYFEAVVRTKLQETAESLKNSIRHSKHQSEIKAPMPGLILKLNKREGDQVQKGEAVVILEAMKMENEIRSPFDGIVTEIKLKEGQPVEKGNIILKITG